MSRHSSFLGCVEKWEFMGSPPGMGISVADSYTAKLWLPITVLTVRVRIHWSLVALGL